MTYHSDVGRAAVPPTTSITNRWGIYHDAPQLLKEDNEHE